MTGIVGRAAQLRLLAGLASALAAGIGGAVLVEGEPGIGKSALLRAGLAGARGTQRWGAADELGQDFPLSLMSRILRLPAAGPAAAGRPAGGGVFAGNPVLGAAERLVEAVDRMCAAGPVVLVAEDLHWADEASVLVWHRLSRLCGQLPLLLAGSCRTGTGRDDLEQLRQSLLARGAAVVTLPPLPDADVRRLAGPLVGGRPGGRLARLLGQAGGNPLFVRELADGLVDAGQVRVDGGIADVAAGALPLPPSLAEAVARRLRRLPASAMPVLRLAAVLGPEFSVTDLSVVAGQTATELIPAIDAALAAGVLAGTGPRLEFRHGVCRQVLHEEMPAALRRSLHLQAARSLAGAGRPADRVAEQLAAAAGPADEWTLGWLRDAAPDLAFRAPQAAASLLAAVLAGGPADPAVRDELEASLVFAAYMLGRHDEVRERGTALMQRAAPELAAEMAWLVAYTLWQAGRHAEGAAIARQALARPGASQPVTARLQAVVAISLADRGALDEATAAARQALDTAAGDPLATGYALNVLAVIDWARGDFAARHQHMEQALAAIGDEPQAAELRLLLLSNSIYSLSFQERTAQALATAQQALVLAERLRTPRLAMFRMSFALLGYEAGQWDDALAELDTAAELTGPRHFPIARHGLHALIAALRDDRKTARAHLAAVADRQLDTLLEWANGGPLLWARALAAEQDERPGDAIGLLLTGLEERFGQLMPGLSDLLPLLGRLALDCGDAGAAQAAAAVAAAEAERQPGLARAVRTGEHCRALLDGDAGLLTAVAGYHQAGGRPFDQAQALEDAAAAAAAAGDLPAARRALTTASTLYADLGARWCLRRAADRLRPFGVRRGRGAARARPGAGWAALTPTEAAVARRIAGRQSNSDIALALRLSPGTVQTHVGHILEKLGARSRADVTVPGP